jgi:hypothetical protein
MAAGNDKIATAPKIIFFMNSDCINICFLSKIFYVAPKGDGPVIIFCPIRKIHSLPINGLVDHHPLLQVFEYCYVKVDIVSGLSEFDRTVDLMG